MIALEVERMKGKSSFNIRDGKTNKEITVYLNSLMADIIDYIETLPKEAVYLFPSLKGSGHITTTQAYRIIFIYHFREGVYVMLEFGAFLILIILFGIFFNTVIIVCKRIKVKINRYSGIDEKDIFSYHLIDNWELELEKTLYLNTIGKWYIWLFTLAMCLVTIYDSPSKINSESKLFLLTMGIAVIVILSGIMWFLHNSSFSGFEKIGMYFIKIGILFSFTIAILDSDIKTVTSVESLFIGIAIPVLFSFLIMKSVVDSFKNNYIFQVFNFIILILLLNFFYIGFRFGLFYGVNNDQYLNANGEFIFFQKEDIYQLNSSSNWGLEEILLVTYKGIKPFFSFTEFKTGKDVIDFIPFFEFILGHIYNLTVIAFFVSYSVSKLINNQELNNSSKKVIESKKKEKDKQ
ncbi:hypothetical protein [Lysinibacillus sp. OTC-L20]|uniref:hypothetical protein n=1 Tax=Lysinibacillus sp. OTC-L20 TaxID=3342791 RepID=UPI0035B89CD8